MANSRHHKAPQDFVCCVCVLVLLLVQCLLDVVLYTSPMMKNTDFVRNVFWICIFAKIKKNDATNSHPSNCQTINVQKGVENID